MAHREKGGRGWHTGKAINGGGTQRKGGKEKKGEIMAHRGKCGREWHTETKGGGEEGGRTTYREYKGKRDEGGEVVHRE